MKIMCFSAALFLAALASVEVAAQAIPSSKFGWDQTAPTLADAQGYTYRIYADGATTGQALANVTCVTTATAGTFSCDAPIPAFTPGNHTATLTASNIAGESAKSSPLAFTFVVTPAVPAGLRIK